MVTGFLLAALVAFTTRAEPQPVSKEDAARWLRWLIPLPKQIGIPAKVILPVSEIGLRLRTGAGEVEKVAAAEIEALFVAKSGAAPKGSRFELLLGTCDGQGVIEGITVPGAEKLAALPNPDQAYVITPVGGNRLALAALNEKGVYYAARTLCQLLESRFEGTQITVPLVEALDWPDLEERGEWGGSAEKDVVWLAAHKMNLVERHVTLKVGPDGKGSAETDADLTELGRRHALKVVPIITHLDQLEGTGIYKVFPDLRGKGTGAFVASQPEMHAPCASDPRFRQVLTDWMTSLASQPGVNDVCAWLSECEGRCGCDACRQAGQYALEARCLVHAWRRAREARPDLRLRILLTQGSYATNDNVIAECPPEVEITYYDGGRTYNSSRDPMIYPLLENYAAQGGRLGCYPQLTASWRIVCPWTGPQFIQARMQEFVDKKLRRLCGYATPDNRLYEFNILAAAEWSWNARGRSPEAFALAWATRRGFKDAEAAARWAVLLGPVGWDVYGSGIPYPSCFGGAAEMIKARQAPAWGAGMFRYFPNPDRLAGDLGVCDEALRIARALDEPELVGETETIGGYLRMIRALAAIAQAYQGGAPPETSARESLQRAMNDLAHATFETCQALKLWERAANQRHCWRGRFCDTLNVTRKTARDVGRILDPIGIEDPSPFLFGHEAGQWTSEEFEGNETIAKVLDVSKWVRGPGVYAVEFVQGAGYNGLKMYQVALVDQSVQPPIEITADEHPGVAASEMETTEYVLRLDAFNPQARYAIAARVTGVRSKDKPENMRGCTGAIFLRKVLEPGTALPEGRLRPVEGAK
jgi:hypothetical protein